MNRRRTAGAAAGASGPLPGGGDRARIAGHHRHVERADVDAQFERIGRHHRAHGPFAQPFLDLPPADRQVAAAIAANPFGRAGRRLEVVLQIGRQDLGRQPALREDDQLQVALEEFRGDPARLAQVRAPDAELMVDDRRIDEDEELLAARRAALLDQLERTARSAARRAHAGSQSSPTSRGRRGSDP